MCCTARLCCPRLICKFEEWPKSGPAADPSALSPSLSLSLSLFLSPFMLCCVRASTILLRNLMAILDADSDRHDSEADRVWKVEQSTLNPHSNNWPRGHKDIELWKGQLIWITRFDAGMLRLITVLQLRWAPNITHTHRERQAKDLTRLCQVRHCLCECTSVYMALALALVNIYVDFCGFGAGSCDASVATRYAYAALVRSLKWSHKARGAAAHSLSWSWLICARLIWSISFFIINYTLNGLWPAAAAYCMYSARTQGRGNATLRRIAVSFDSFSKRKKC